MTYEEPVERVPVARAYVYCGDWVADCPRIEEGTWSTDYRQRSCGNVEFLYVPSRMNGPRHLRREFYMCSNCGMQSGIDWPRREEAILQVLMLRPVPSNRNWYPKDHPVAVHFRIPHGQSIDDLLNENEEHKIDNAPLR